jgi:hypothetical protein
MARYHGYGEITKKYKKAKKTPSMCCGCYDNHYNTGKDRCWSWEIAKVVDKLAFPNIYSKPKERKIYKKTLDCYHGVNK